jgi:hypothetical protein
VRKITEWNPIRMRSKECPNIDGRDEVVNVLEKLRVKNWPHLVRDRKAWYEQTQKTASHKEL